MSKNLSILKLKSDHSYSGDIEWHLAGENIIWGDWVYVNSDGKIYKGYATTQDTAWCIGMAVQAISQDTRGMILMDGFVRDDSWAWTKGSINPIYLSETPGVGSQTPPTGEDKAIQVLARPVTATILKVRPSEVVFTLKP